jgi:hypothetical protein
MTSIYFASHLNLRRIKTVLSVGLFLLLMAFLIALMVVPDRVDPLEYQASLAAPIIKIINNKGQRFAIYRVKPGKVFMIHEVNKNVGEIIKIKELVFGHILEMIGFI